jgi:ABC-type branched-subunit amino acid transport system substrate-binding protein
MVHKQRRRDFVKTIGTAGIIGLAGCGGDGDGTDTDADMGTDTDTNGDETDTPTGRTIDLGILMGVTGGLQELGPPIRDAAQLVPQQINDADTGFEVNVQFEDTGTDAQQGVSGAQALADAGFPMYAGALASAVSLQAARDVAIPNEMVACSPASTAPDYSDLDGDFTFRTAVPDSFQGEVLARIANERLGAGTAATFAQDDSYGRGLAGAFADSFESQFDGTITDQVIFTEGETSYTSQLETALQGDPDTMLIVAFPEDGVRIFQDFYQDFDRNDMDLLVSDGLQDSSLPGDVGFDMTNVTGTAPIGSGPGLDFFNESIRDTYGGDYEDDPASKAFVRQAYDAAATLVLANAAAGENNGVAVRDNVRPVTDSGGTEVTPSNLVEGVEMAAAGDEIEYRGVSGEITYDENGDQSNIAYQYFEFTEDGLEEIETITL